ncbi:MAG: hypothetical protein UR90_C0001G0010 [Parcubacteria group bacterium GW2011_GWC1_35_8]|uniref:Uncharacterized protein n=3 Tax=Candidatus Nomuraibacteriota TaxID=1752729 RepID=A0A1F6YT88_9BACT|nr:MAG: hypothetical protein UR90_C0001G0010 [Parcubacteria group bacterium GW2011_GWC1_35_8]KKP89268.1 MAG: hypothetical protein UR91_C0005G0004 [Candidatus Nomurabacteria bacterium GW2011_GWC2_35_8]OGJ05268.1 MAG: hypothetical protein A2238_03350 [Candidatus Nomurabacteria bacterium RIFOXYA2_FULL_35_9]OGJ05729.1 MAG: hypothetical protein A2192_02160 [Candidatus Nomurabacteria bacterium RIFOXYA1_FULL_35_17]OGJ09576.1 MAG: hypothetical protein A2456_03645 [Candidatus Nomurabacteria bacterium RI
MLKQKKVLWIAFAIVFLVVLFLTKTGFFSSLFNNEEVFKNTNQEDSLVYSDETIADLVNKDTDGDGVLDWQENLYGLDPNKKETTAGTPDSVAISKLKAENGTIAIKTENGSTVSSKEENLTETEKFSRELFAIVATANQNGTTMDQASVDALGASLSERVQNAPQRKVFLTSDIKTTNDNSVQAFKNYNNTLNDIFTRYTTLKYGILDVLQKFIPDENTVDANALSMLGPIIDQTNKIITGMLKTSVPQSISILHLDVINDLEGLLENISDIKLYDNDPIMALGGITKYEGSTQKLVIAVSNLTNAINQKLGN